MAVSRVSIAAVCIGALLATGCSGGGKALPSAAGTTLPAGSKTGTAGTSGSARLVVTIPHGTSSTTSAQRRPAYVSPATQALAVTVTDTSGGATVLSEGINLSNSNPACTTDPNSDLSCTVSLTLAPCSGGANCYTGTFVTYDQQYTGTTNGTCSPLSSCTQPMGAYALSQAQSVPFTVAANALNTIPITLGGVPVSVQIVSQNAALLSGSVATGFTLMAGATATASVFGLDADNNLILGAGAPTVSVSSSDTSQVSVSGPTSTAPNTVTLTSVSQTSSVQITATVTPTSASGANQVNLSAVVAPPTPRLIYVTNSDSASSTPVTVYDQSGNQQTVSGSFSGLVGPYGIAYDPANGLLYVTDYSGNTVTVYDQNGNLQTVSGTFSGLSYSAGIAYDPANGFLYVTNVDNNTVTVYDQNGNLQNTFGSSSLNSPWGIAYDPANGFLYVTNPGNNTVTVYDQNGNLQNTFGSSSLDVPEGMAYDQANGWLYVANYGSSDSVTVYDQNGTQQSVSGSFSGLNGPDSIAYDPANGLLYVANGNTSTVTVYDQNGDPQSTRGFPHAGYPEGIAVVP